MGIAKRADSSMCQPHARSQPHARDRLQRQRPARRAMALLVVMVLTMLVALGAYRYSFTMQAQYRVTRIFEEQAQARLAALSGLELAAAILENPLAQREVAGGLENNPALFQHVAVGDAGVGITAGDMGSASSTANSTTVDPSARWRVSLLAPAGGGSTTDGALDGSSASLAGGTTSDSADGQSLVGVRFGLENQSAKLHIPTLLEWEKQLPGHARAALMRLPQAESGPVDDWLRRHGISSSGGLSGESRLTDRMQSSTSTDDQSASRDWFRMQWLGGDLNQNYRIDDLESMIAESLRGDVAGGASTQLGSSAGLGGNAPVAWQQYLSWHGGERNESQSGRPRVNLNQDNLQELHRQLLTIWPTDRANFVIALRQYGPGQVVAPTGSTAEAGTSAGGGASPASRAPSSTSASQDLNAGTWTPDFSKPATFRLRSVLDVVDVRLSVPDLEASSDGGGTSIDRGSASSSSSSAASTARNRVLPSPFSSEPSLGSDYNERLLDESTVDMATSRVGRVDLRQAPLEVLAGVPGIDEQLAQQIVAQRDTAGAANAGSLGSSRMSIAWLLSDGLVDLAQLKKLEPFLTCRSDVYRTQAVGYRDELTPVYRCTAVIDARQLPAQIIDHQVWHAWDRGFPTDRFAPNVQ